MDVNKELDKIAKMQVKVLMERRRKKRQRLLVTQVLLDYTKNSTLHGLRYITERSLKNFEKVFWLLTFLLSFAACLYCISNVYWKWIDSPVIVTVSEKLVPVESVPFPSITICPQIRIKASKYRMSGIIEQMEQLEKNIENLEAEQIKWNNHSYSDEINNLRNILSYELDKFNDLSHMICQDYLKIDSTCRSNDSSWNTNKIIDTIIDISSKPEDIFLECSSYGIFKSCDDFFHRVLTSEGVCYNFNSIAADELFHHNQAIVTNITESKHKIVGWNPETGYDDSGIKPFPNHGHENTDSPDLSVVLTIADYEKDLYCNNRNSGFKVYFHNPLDLPQSSLYYYAAIENQVTLLAVNLNILSTSESLMHYAPDVRQCYFQKEKYLKFFKVYTVKNCQMECLANITLKTCECVGFYMPRIENTTVCDSNQTWCMQRAHKLMVSLGPRPEDDAEDDEYRYCHCLPLCNSVEYDAEVLKTNYNRTLDQMFDEIAEKLVLNDTQTSLNFKKKFSSNESIKYSKIEIFSKKLQYISMRRSEMLGVFGFVANIGGLLGLFLGFSVLSLIEIFYYLTVRIGVILKRDEKEEDIYATT